MDYRDMRGEASKYRLAWELSIEECFYQTNPNKKCVSNAA